MLDLLGVQWLMRTKKRRVLPLLVSLVALSVLWSPIQTVQAEASDEVPIVFEDPVFARLLQAELGKETILPSDLVGFSGIQIAADEYLFLSGQGRPGKNVILYGQDTFEYESRRYTGYGTIKTLIDLKHFPNLTALRVTLQPQLDYGTIPNLDRLVQINITQSKLTSITFLSTATRLTWLNMAFNEIKEIGPLANCVSLRTISFNWNQISDLTPLAGLAGLKSISFYGNKITDISALGGLKNLEELGFYNNQITDIAVLKGLTNLKSVEFINNNIKDVSPLKDFSSFDRLALTGNPIKNIKVLKHIKNLEF